MHRFHVLRSSALIARISGALTGDPGLDGGGGGGGGGGGSPPPPPPPPSPPFYAGIEDADLRGWVEQAGYKDLGGLAKSARDTIAMRGKPAEAFVERPDWTKAEARHAFFQSLGYLPKEATLEAYGLTVPDGGDADFMTKAIGWLNARGMHPEDVKSLVQEWGGYGAELTQAETQRRETKSAAEISALQTEWGANYKGYEEQARRAFRKFGGDAQQLAEVEAAMGTANFLKHYQKIGEALGESFFADENGGGGGNGGGKFKLSPEAATARKTQLLADPAYQKRFMDGDVAATREINDLNEIIASAM